MLRDFVLKKETPAQKRARGVHAAQYGALGFLNICLNQRHEMPRAPLVLIPTLGKYWEKRENCMTQTMANLA